MFPSEQRSLLSFISIDVLGSRRRSARVRPQTPAPAHHTFSIISQHQPSVHIIILSSQVQTNNNIYPNGIVFILFVVIIMLSVCVYIALRARSCPSSVSATNQPLSCLPCAAHSLFLVSTFPLMRKWPLGEKDTALYCSKLLRTWRMNGVPWLYIHLLFRIIEGRLCVYCLQVFVCFFSLTLSSVV